MRDIVLVTVDSLRADHVGWHGYDRNTTPNLDERAASAETFTSAFSHACSTRPSFPSIMTSSYALEYGGFERLSPKRTTIAELLNEAGYETAGFHSNLYLSADFGYSRGFDRFFDSKSDPGALAKLRKEVKTHLDSDGALYGLLQQAFNATEKQVGIELGSAYVDAERITERALEWVRSKDNGPRFLWVHYMDVHHPYVPPEKYQERFRDHPVSDRDAVQLRRKMLESPDEITDEELGTLIDLYDAEIAYVDAEVDRLVTTLCEEWGDDPVFAFTSDHGEEFLDHDGFSHSATFYDEVLHVPLLVRPPGGVDGERIHDPAALTRFPAVARGWADGRPPEQGFRAETVVATKQPVTGDLRDRFARHCDPIDPYTAPSRCVYTNAEGPAVRKRYYWGEEGADALIRRAGHIEATSSTDRAAADAAFTDSAATVRKPREDQAVTDRIKDQLAALGYY